MDYGCILERKKPWDVILRLFRLQMKDEMRPIIRLRQPLVILIQPPKPPEPPGPPDSPPGWPPAPSRAGERERVGLRSPSRERLPCRPSQPEPQLSPIPMNDSDDDQPPPDERSRGRS